MQVESAVQAIEAGIRAFMGSSQIWDSDEQITDFAYCVLDTITEAGFDIKQRVIVIPDPPGFELPWADG